MMLIIGVTLFSEVSKHFAPGDQGRIAAQVVTGVGFLGAGTILRLGAEVKGLTSAASLWAVSAIGMAVSTGGSFLVVAVEATVLAIFTLAVVDIIEKKLVPNAHLRVLQVTLAKREALSNLLQALEKSEGRVLGIRLTDVDGGLHVQMDVQGGQTSMIAAAIGCAEVSEASWVD